MMYQASKKIDFTAGLILAGLAKAHPNNYKYFSDKSHKDHMM